MTNSLIGPILIRNSHVSARFKLRSTGLSSEISLLGFAERRSPVYVTVSRRWGKFYMITGSGRSTLLDFAIICHVICHIWSCMYSTRQSTKSKPSVFLI